MESPDDLEGLFFLAETGSAVAEIDVHGLRVTQALVEADRLLHAVFLKGERLLRIVHGKGEGALREALHRAWVRHALVAGVREAATGGMTLIVLVER